MPAEVVPDARNEKSRLRIPETSRQKRAAPISATALICRQRQIASRVPANLVKKNSAENASGV
jgi:hypothetical protein